MLHNKLIITLFISLTLILGCKEKKELEKPLTPSSTEQTNLTYAKGFSISKTENATVLEVYSPWPNAEKSYKYLLVTKAQAKTNTYNTKDFEDIITIPIKKIVVTSTTHIPALDLLGVENTLVGFPGTAYVSSKKIRARINNKEVRELGKNESINTEVLLELQPDLVIGFGIDGNSRSFETIKKSGIPVIFNGDWVEGSPLAKAEWIKLFGMLYNKEKVADSIFNHIEKDYLEAKKLASHVKNKLTVLSGAMHKDIWYLPNGTSSEAQLLKDANVNYLWSTTTESGSLALNFETVFEKAKHANLWISPSYYATLEALEKASKHYTKFDAFKNKNIYSFVNTTGETGGVLYYELGIARPDLVLKDLIKICHPELLQDYQTYFFKPLK